MISAVGTFTMAHHATFSYIVALGAVGMYSVFTLKFTKWRTQFRLDMNKAENEAGNKAIGKLKYQSQSEVVKV